ncbi:hypothetical protein [uncultured Tateyamaria sp.]|uniref:hypothetical protein n=1 Tax=uncultured Tateyamaria sp. TaxID=455651 RepID=UPI0026316414|nr:hypothetical protein [uncultured Tateyamaria sp.]
MRDSSAHTIQRTRDTPRAQTLLLSAVYAVLPLVYLSIEYHQMIETPEDRIYWYVLVTGPILLLLAGLAWHLTPVVALLLMFGGALHAIGVGLVLGFIGLLVWPALVFAALALFVGIASMRTSTHLFPAVAGEDDR